MPKRLSDIIGRGGGAAKPLRLTEVLKKRKEEESSSQAPVVEPIRAALAPTPAVEAEQLPASMPSERPVAGVAKPLRLSELLKKPKEEEILSSRSSDRADARHTRIDAARRD